MEKINILKDSIDPIVSLTEDELLRISDVFEEKTFEKNEFFLKEGHICNYIGFLSKGALIYFKAMESGDYKTTDFAFEGDWVTNNLSRLTNAPALLNIKAIERSELYIIKGENLGQLYIEIPKIERLGRILMELSFLRIAQHSIDLQLLSAKERYKGLLKRYPQLFQRAPQYHIANYLGIAPKSLSRIRSEILLK